MSKIADKKKAAYYPPNIWIVDSDEWNILYRDKERLSVLSLSPCECPACNVARKNWFDYAETWMRDYVNRRDYEKVNRDWFSVSAEFLYYHYGNGGMWTL